MSLHYIIDGYNVVKQALPWVDMPLEGARNSFLEFIRDEQLCGSLRNKITVVFDGRSDLFSFGSQKENYPGFCVVFSSGESADDTILQILNKSPNAKSIIVVSDDRALRLSARSYGAQLMGVREFLGKADKASKHTAKNNCDKLPISEEKKINEELRKIWLKEK